jgi:glutathione S-transferase
MTYRYLKLVPQHPAHPHLKRWYAALEARASFREHVTSIPLT